jgi:hypothetical protein
MSQRPSGPPRNASTKRPLVPTVVGYMRSSNSRGTSSVGPDRLNHAHFRSYQPYLLREPKMQPRTVRLLGSELSDLS